MFKILTQDHVTVSEAHVQTLSQQGPFASFSAASAFVQDLLSAARMGGRLPDTVARQVTAELMARKITKLDPLGAEMALQAHLDLALEGGPLHPAVVSRILVRMPFKDVVDFEIALGEALRDVFGATPRTSKVHALAHDLADASAFDIENRISLVEAA